MDRSDAEGLSSKTQRTLEESSRIFGTIAENARRAGDPATAERLEARVREAAERLERLRGRGADQRTAATGSPGPEGVVLRVLLADDHELAREALQSLLARSPGFEVVGEAVDGHEAVARARELRPDVVVMDLRMPGMDGLAATREIVASCPGTRVVMLSSFEQREYVLQALRAGASGYLPKGASKQELLATLFAAYAGDIRVGGELAAQLLQQEAGDGVAAPPRERLSERETEVLRLLARGRTNDQIARELHLSTNTIKTHVSRVLNKLDAPDRAAAVARGAALGLLGD